MRTFLTNARIGQEDRIRREARIGQEARIGWETSENFFNNNISFDNNFEENFFDQCQNWPGGQMNYTLSFT